MKGSKRPVKELAAHIGEVVVNKCLSAAAIYLACLSQLEDKRKTLAEICKVTGLTEVTKFPFLNLS
jgi:transcription initiation factor TFIIB